MKKGIRETRAGRMTAAAMIAAVYAVLTLLLQPISFGALQLRASEALTLLPVIFPEAVSGLAFGCAISNLIGVATGANICGIADVFFGTAATLGAAILSRMLRRYTWHGFPILSALMPVIFNGIIIGAELAVVLGLPFWLCALEVAGGEALAVFALGLPLTKALQKHFDRRNGIRP